MADPDRPQMTAAHSHCALDKQDTRSNYVIIIALPLQQWLHERALVLRYMLFLQENNEQRQDKLRSVYIIRRSKNSVKPRRTKTT